MSFPVYSGQSTESPIGTESPYSPEVMALYLQDCHCKYVTEEKPAIYKEFQLREKLYFTDRQFWVWQCNDSFGRIWDVVVGQGRDPTFGKSGTSIWTTGDLYVERHPPRDIVVDEFPEHASESGRTHS